MSKRRIKVDGSEEFVEVDALPAGTWHGVSEDGNPCSVTVKALRDGRRKVTGHAETVYVDRPWPTPKSLRALRRLLFPEQTPDVAAAAERSRAVREDLDVAAPRRPGSRIDG